MSTEWMLKTLESIGLKRLDAELYLYLMQNGLATAQQLADALEIDKREIYRITKKLEHNNFVSIIPGRRNRFSAAPFDSVVDNLIQDNQKGIRFIEHNKEALLKEWKKCLRG